MHGTVHHIKWWGVQDDPRKYLSCQGAQPVRPPQSKLSGEKPSGGRRVQGAADALVQSKMVLAFLILFCWGLQKCECAQMCPMQFAQAKLWCSGCMCLERAWSHLVIKTLLHFFTEWAPTKLVQTPPAGGACAFMLLLVGLMLLMRCSMMRWLLWVMRTASPLFFPVIADCATQTNFYWNMIGYHAALMSLIFWIWWGVHALVRWWHEQTNPLLLHRLEHFI